MGDILDGLGMALLTNSCGPEAESHRELLGDNLAILHLSKYDLVFLNLLYPRIRKKADLLMCKTLLSTVSIISL